MHGLGLLVGTFSTSSRPALRAAGLGRQAHQVPTIPSAVLQGLTPAGVTAVKQVAGLQLDAVGLLQLLDPVVLDGDAVPRGQLVVLPRAGTILVRQDGRQLLEVGFQSTRR